MSKKESNPSAPLGVIKPPPPPAPPALKGAIMAIINLYYIVYYNGFEKKDVIVTAYTAEDAITQLKNSTLQCESIIEIRPYDKKDNQVKDLNA